MKNLVTLERYNGVRIELLSSDKIINYAGTVSFSCGIIAIIFGLFSFALGIAAICTKSSAAFIGYGIWCGIMFVTSGIIYASTCRSYSAWSISLLMIISSLSIFCSAIQLSLGIVGTSYDANRKAYYLDAKDYYVYDIFGPRNAAGGPFCSGNDNYNFNGSWAPVNILLLLSGFLELLCHLVVLILAVNSLCCGTREVHRNQVDDQTGFSQLDYHSGLRSELPIYKVSQHFDDFNG